VSVKRIMPVLVGSFVIIVTLTICHLAWYQLVLLRRRRRVDNIQVAPYGRMVWTSRRRRPDGEARTGSEGRGAGQDQDAEPAPRSGPGRGLRLLGLLRRCRSGAGQVRDGAPGRGRRDCGKSRSAFVRFLAAVLLHGSRGVGLPAGCPPWCRPSPARGGPTSSANRSWIIWTHCDRRTRRCAPGR